MPPSGSGKDKILYTEAVGLVMIDYGDAVVGGFGKWGRSEFGQRESIECGTRRTMEDERRGEEERRGEAER